MGTREEHVCKGGIADIETGGLGKAEKKEAFIEMRAKGLSLQKCAEALQVSKATLCNWSREMEEEIARFKAIEVESLQERYLLTKEARIKLLGERLETINQELDGRGLGDVPTAKLLEMALSIQKELKAEYVEPVFQSDQEMETVKMFRQASMLA